MYRTRSSTRVGTISGGGGTNCALSGFQFEPPIQFWTVRIPRCRSSGSRPSCSASMSVIVMPGELTSSPDAVRRTAMLFATSFALSLRPRTFSVRPSSASATCCGDGAMPSIIELEMASERVRSREIAARPREPGSTERPRIARSAAAADAPRAPSRASGRPHSMSGTYAEYRPPRRSAATRPDWSAGCQCRWMSSAIVEGCDLSVNRQADH